MKIGSGFAIKVYLPALIRIGHKKIALEVKTKMLQNLNQRKQYRNIKWLTEDEIKVFKYSKYDKAQDTITKEKKEVNKYKLFCSCS